MPAESKCESEFLILRATKAIKLEWRSIATTTFLAQRALHEPKAPYPPEGLYTRRMSLYTSQRLLTRPKGITRDGCRFTRANGSLLARRALHATNVALHEPTAPYPPEGPYTRRMSPYTPLSGNYEMKLEEDIKKAVEVMRQGGVILYPTDTIWGIGCDATNEEAVARVYRIKQREDSKALICLVDSDARLQRYVRDVPEVAWDVMEMATKPTTVILDNAVNLAPNLIAEDGSIGMRITREAFSKELCYRFQKPIVSTSANISGEPAAQNYRDIAPEILEAVDYVCFTRRQEHQPHQPSSIIKIKPNGEIKIIR